MNKISTRSVAMFIALLLITGGAAFYLFSKTLTLTPDQTANWKTYTNNDAKISIETPLEWTATDEGFRVEGSESKRITLEGKEGKVQIDWGSGFGGACPQGYETLKLYSETIDVCHNVDSDGTEKWSLSIGKVNAIDYAGFAIANSPYASNRDVILKILSTFKFTDPNSPNLSKTSPDGSYTITETMMGDYNAIVVKNSSGQIITNDLIKKNENAIGYGTKFGCQCGTSFAGWTDSSHFILKIVNGNGEEYQYTVDARTGIVNETSFKKVK